MFTKVLRLRVLAGEITYVSATHTPLAAGVSRDTQAPHFTHCTGVLRGCPVEPHVIESL